MREYRWRVQYRKKKFFFSGEGKLFCESCRLQGEDVAKCYFLHPSLRRVASLDLPIMLTASLVYLGMHSDVLPWKSKWQERWTVELFWQQECGCWVGTDLHPRVDRSRRDETFQLRPREKTWQEGVQKHESLGKRMSNSLHHFATLKT